MSRLSSALNFILPLFFLSLTLSSQVFAQPSGLWISTWTTSPQPQLNSKIISNQTIRQVVHTQIGGDGIRVRISNLYGQKPLVIAAAAVCVRLQDSECQAGSQKALTANGKTKIEIAPGQEIATDEVTFALEPFTELAISFYFADPTPLATVHQFAKQFSYFYAGGDVSLKENFSPSTQNSVWYFLSGVDVLTLNPGAKAIVAFGDSITDGVGTKVEQNGDYPLLLAERFGQAHKEYSVLNAGIGANMVLEPQNWQNAWSDAGIKRFSHDVLAQPGAQAVLMLEGINDITFEPATTTPEQLAAKLTSAYIQLAQTAHARGLKFYMATLTPTGGSSVDSVAHQNARTLVNHWIRSSTVIDGFFDFDLALRDPQNPLRMQAAYDSSDHLHPNANGYLEMAKTIELKDF